MEYASLQERVYANKRAKGFNITDVGKEVMLLTEELGELCAARIATDHDATVDAIGDIAIYCLGLCAMFEWNADKVVERDLPSSWNAAQEIPCEYLAMEIGLLAKTYRRSNRAQASEFDRQAEFRTRIGLLLGYCRDAFTRLGEDESAVLESIVRHNEERTAQVRL